MARVAKRGGRAVILALLATTVPGCVAVTQHRLGPGEEPVLVGPAVRENRTPMDPAFACFGSQLAGGQRRGLVIAVGEVRDFTGKYSVTEGTAITQGGALMVASALGKLGGPVTLAERFDPTIGERELGYTDRRQLGDGRAHAISGPSGTAAVPWLPYYGGTITASDYYIVGGITELNYNIRSGGAEVRVGQVGPKRRTYTQSVAIDLRIVDTRTLLVARTISLTKQFTGYEVGFNTFRFFGSELFDINIGAKAQEPLQLGIRTALEEATLRLVASVSGADPSACIAQRTWAEPGNPAPAIKAVRSGARQGAAAALKALGTSAAPLTLAFAPGSDALSASSAGLLAQVLLVDRKGRFELVLTAPDSEAPDPAARDALTDRRIAAVMARLVALGIHPDRIGLLWRPQPGGLGGQQAISGFRTITRLSVAG